MRKSNGIVKILKPERLNAVKKILRKSWFILASLIITLAIVSSVFRALTPWARQYKPQVEQHLSQLLGQSVSIGQMETGWYWFEPVIKLNQVKVNGAEVPALQLDKLLLGINLFSSLRHWKIQPGMLFIDNVHVVLREKDGQWHIDGIGKTASDLTHFTPQLLEHYLAWLALEEKLIIKGVSANLYREDGRRIDLSQLNIKLVNHGGRYKLQGEAKLGDSSARVVAEFNLNPAALEQTRGQLFLELNQISPAQLQLLLPKRLQGFDQGHGRLKLWMDVDEGKITTLQGQVGLKSLAWHTQDHHQQRIKAFNANLAWQKKETGWQFSADKIYLRTPGLRWPENQFQVNFNQQDNSYKVYVKSIIIESLLLEAANWYAPLKKYLDMQAHGELSDTQLQVKDGQVNYLLSRFDKIGWQSDASLPSVNHLTGVLHWEPASGHLELDSKNTLVAFKGVPAQTFSVLNGAFDWKALSHGLRLSIERFVLTQPDLTLSIHGVLEDVKKESVDEMYLVTDFSVKKIHRWYGYIPDKAFKPKFIHWLKTNLKHIEQGNGRLILRGKPKDFPFDNTAGEFKLRSQFSGVQMQISPQWPVIREIDGYLRMNKRDLEIDLVHANIQGIPVKEINLKIADIGHDKETLLVHGRGKGEAAKLVDFLMSSPLKDRLSMLNLLKIKGLLGLNLYLKIPLYLPPGHVLAKGQVDLDDNTLKIHHRLGELNLEQLSGQLNFDQSGITDSGFKAKAYGYPFKLALRTEKEPEPATSINIQNEMPIEELRKFYPLAVLERMEGEISTNISIRLTADPNDLDSINIQSSMQGLFVDLPAPLGKSSQSIKPLSLKLDFNPKKALRLRVNYDNQLSSDLWFNEEEGNFNLYSGEVRLGSGNAIKQSQPGIRVIGSLDNFNASDWQSCVKDISNQAGSYSLLPHLNFVDLHFKKAQFFNNNLNDLTLKAFKTENKDWSISIKQDKVFADLRYQTDKNKLSGYFKRLTLNRSKAEQGLAKKESFELEPNQIPDLNLRIDDLKIDEHPLGQLTIKSHSKDHQWLLDYGKLETGYYQMFMKADWTKNGKQNKTTLENNLYINNLSKLLEQFKIDPVVEANKGELLFTGEWPGGISDFSIDTVKGTMAIKFNDGRITNLSKETEEKLGLGKLLSILSLQTIPRRLKLDFSDLSQKGYSFDIFKGQFQLSKGKMATRDSYIDGPVAYASMKGKLDLNRRLYDLELKVSPHITASLPVVATIAGGPIAGIATWLASKIINKGMNKISAYTYKVSGPWDKPVVQQISIIKKPR